MNKKILVAILASAMLLTVLVAAAVASNWGDHFENDSPEKVEYTIYDEDGNVNEESLNYVMFVKYGPLLLILAILMFGAMIGGVCIAREEVESDDTD